MLERVQVYTATMQTAAKARLTSAATWRISMNECPLTTFRISPNSDESGKQSLYPDGDPDRHQNLTCSFAHCQPSMKIMQVRSEVFAKSSNRQTDILYKQRRTHNLLEGGNNNLDVDGEDAVRSRRLFVQSVSGDGAICFTLTTSTQRATQKQTEPLRFLRFFILVTFSRFVTFFF